jgi:hypothetical protein
MHPKLHLSYAILVRMSKNVMITLHKYKENPLKISFLFSNWGYNRYLCLPADIEIVPPSGYTEVFQGGTISMPTHNW